MAVSEDFGAALSDVPRGSSDATEAKPAIYFCELSEAGVGEQAVADVRYVG